MDPPAIRVVRGDVTESVHRASVAVADGQGRLVAGYGDPHLVTFLRSTAKPFQALALVESGAADAFRFTPEDLAVAIASHNGEPEHVQRVRSMLERIGQPVSSLRCGRHPPMGKAAALRLGPDFDELHHNCSGKHAGMLAACVHNGWPVATYLEPSHPLQQAVLRDVSELSGIPQGQLRVAVDGCGVPTFAMPLVNMAVAFARYTTARATDAGHGPALARLRSAMLANPLLIAGSDRLDTAFMRAFEGDVWVKAGAEACYAFGITSLGVAGVAKVEDGSGRAMAPLLFRVLDELGVVSERQRKELEPLWDEPVRNVAGRTVGRYECDLRLSRPAIGAPRVTRPAGR